MKEKDWEDKPDPDVNYYEYVRDQHGRLVAVGFIRRNRRRVPYFPPFATDSLPPDEEGSPDYVETVAIVTYDLTPLEAKCFLRVTEDGLSISELAKEEGVTRPALYSRFRRMRLKNVFVEAWWAMKRHVNQHA